MSSPERVELSRRERQRSWALWAGVLVGPAAWSTHLVVSYSLEEFISCAPASRSPGEILGVGVEPLVIVLNFVLACVTAAAGLLALSCLRRAHPDGISAERARWMALAGVMTSVLFFIIIIAGVAPPAFLETCRVSP